MTSFLSTYLAASVNLALKVIGVEFGVGPSELSLIASIYLLFTSLCLVPFGKLCDNYGPKRTLVFGCAFFTLTNLVVPLLAHSFPLLILLRGLQGIAAAFLMVSNTPIVTDAVPKQHRSMALGCLSGMVYFGYSVGNYLGGILTETWGWRSIFISAGICGALAMVVIWVLIPEGPSRTKKNRTLDLPGIAFYALTLLCLQFGAARLTTGLGRGLLLLCVVSFVLFLRRQWTVADPIYDVRLFVSNGVFAMSNLAVFFNFTATYGSQYLLAFYLQCNRGLDAAEAGKITLFQPLMQIFFSPLGGFLADRTSPAAVASSGMAVIAVALFMLASLTDTTDWWIIYTALILIGIGISFFSAPNTGLIMDSVPPEKRGMAAASNSVMRNVGMQCSVILCGTAFLLALGSVKGFAPSQYPDMLRATRSCYMLFATLCMVGAVISLKRVRPAAATTNQEEVTPRAPESP